MTAPQYKPLRRAYGFDEVALVPGDITVNPDQTDIELKIDQLILSVPIMAAAMDAVTDVNFATLMSQAGGLAVLNLEGVQTRYENPQEMLAEITRTPGSEVTARLQKIYAEPIKENLIGDRIQVIKRAGAVCAVSAAPANAKRFAPIAAEAKADIYFVQSTVT
ncbi:MAG: IMP dehydrogenase, partial [Chloroflexota bacterium]